MIGPPLPAHFGGNFRSRCKTAETLRFAGLAYIKASFKNAAYGIPPAYIGTLHYYFR